MNHIDLSELNPGIRRTVTFLREHHYETCDSGDGKTHEFECDTPMPYVHIEVVPASALIDKADALLTLLTRRGVSFAGNVFNGEGEMIGPHIEAHYTPTNGLATISLFNVADDLIFRENDEARTGEKDGI